MIDTPKRVPDVTFKTRVRDETVEGPNPYRWQNRSTDEIFKGRRVVPVRAAGGFHPRPAVQPTSPVTKTSARR